MVTEAGTQHEVSTSKWESEAGQQAVRPEWGEEKESEGMGRKGGKAKSKKASSRQHERHRVRRQELETGLSK